MPDTQQNARQPTCRWRHNHVATFCEACLSWPGYTVEQVDGIHLGCDRPFCGRCNRGSEGP